MSTHFKITQKFTSEFSPNEFTLYESDVTGLRVVTVDQKGPKVYGFFALATEIHDDSGAPHTLEHLVFMGSKSYKYKGLLDRLATKAYSNTNAWTGTDQTVYTLETAGWAGFAGILPVYLEHVLLPTLTDSACLTEVHHVDGTGRDAGVVYSEMQGLENQPSSIMELAARRLLYPKSNAFRSETGGLMDQLRVLTADRIRSFHREMYQPKNMCLVLVGEIDHPNLLQILDKFEDGIKSSVPRLDEPFKRPWSRANAPRLENSTVTEIKFPEEDESMGELLIGFLGPEFEDELANDALAVMLVYICGSSVSLMENVLVEKEQLCSSISYSTDQRADTVLWFSVSGVETQNLHMVEERIFQVLKEAASKPLDMGYLNDCLVRYRRQLKYYAETLTDFFSEAVIADHLFGKRDGSTLRQIANLATFDSLTSWTEPEWRRFLSQWIADAHHVSLLGVPSKELSDRIKSTEEQRVKAQQDQLGEAGLADMARRLEEAKQENERPIPQEVFDQFATPSTDSIHFISTTPAKAGLARQKPLQNEVQKVIDADRDELPLFLHFEHIPSNFVSLRVILCTHVIPVELRPLMPVYFLNFFNTPVVRDGVTLDFEAVVTQLEKDTVNYDLESGSRIGNFEMMSVRVEVEPEKYNVAIKWLKDLLYNSVFDAERIKSTLNKILAELPQSKREGDAMAASVLNMVHYSRASTNRASNVLVKSVYLKRIRALLKRDPQAVLDKLEALRHSLVQPSNFRVFARGDWLSGRVATPVSSWEGLFPQAPGKGLQLQPLDETKATMSAAGASPGSLAYIVPLPIDSSYAYLAARIPDSYEHPEIPALRVALAFLGATEGPLYAGIRGMFSIYKTNLGTGLAYGVDFTKDIPMGRMALTIYSSPDAYKAYKATRKIVEDLASGQVPIDQNDLEGAVSTIVVGFANEQPNMAAAATVNFAYEVIRGLPKDFSSQFLKRVRSVTAADVRAAIGKWIVPALHPGSADLFVTCAAAMQEGFLQGFRADGFNAEVQPLSFFEDEYGLAAVEDDDDDEDESMDEDEDDEDGSSEEER